MKKENMMTTLYRILLVLLLLGSSLTLGSNAFSATMPEFKRLDSLANKTGNPTSVTVDSQGRLYVAEMLDNKVSVFSQGGKLLATRYNFGKPVSIAADPASGTIFVGSLANGSVLAYSSSFNRKFKLGSGSGEFGHPADIDVDGSGRIYVADKNNGVVKVYNSDGTPAGAIGTPGSGNGQLNQPTGIAVDPIKGEIIVLDHQLTFDIFANANVEGARLQFFSLGGQYLRAKSLFGYKMELGQLVRPVDVAVDGQSRVYVTDSRLNKVMVYDVTADSRVLNFLGMIDSTLHPLRAPLGLTVTSSNLLYVTYSRTNDKGVDVYGLDAFSASLVDPTHLAFSAIYGGNDPLAQNLDITNLGNTPFDWTATTETPWVTLSTASGTIDASGTGTADVTVNIGDKEPGTYNGGLTVVADTGATENITVTLTVDPNPLQVSPAGIDLQTTVGVAPASQTLSIASISDAVLNWKATAGQEWMTLSADTGTTPATVKVSIDVAGLAVGNHNGTVTVMQQGDNPCPVTIPVTLSVNEFVQPPASAEALPAVGSSIKVRNKIWSMVSPLAGTDLEGTNLNGVWGMGADNIYVVGDKGAILKYDGDTWSSTTSGANNLNSVWGSAADNIYAVGDAGTMLHSVDGATWAAIGSATGDLQDIGIDQKTVAAPDYTSIWGSAADDIFRVGNAGLIEHSTDGQTWEAMTSNTTAKLNSVWGAAGDNVFAVGNNCTILNYDGTNWTDMNPAGENQIICGDLNGIWGSSAGDIYAVDSVGQVLQYRGNTWSIILFDSSVTRLVFNDVWASEKSFVVAVGNNGLVLTGQKKGFPWNTVIRTIASKNAMKMQAQKDKEDQK